MPLPSSLKTVRVFGKYLTPSGAPVRGRIAFEANFTHIVDGLAVVPQAVAVSLDLQGSFELYLPATDDPALHLDGVASYKVIERFPGQRAPYSIAVPFALDELNVNDASPLVRPERLLSSIGPPNVLTVGSVTKLDADSVSYRLQRFANPAVATGVMSGSVYLPASNAFLMPRAYINNGGTAAAAQIDLARIYLETDY